MQDHLPSTDERPRAPRATPGRRGAASVVGLALFLSVAGVLGWRSGQHPRDAALPTVASVYRFLLDRLAADDEIRFYVRGDKPIEWLVDSRTLKAFTVDAPRTTEEFAAWAHDHPDQGMPFRGWDDLHAAMPRLYDRLWNAFAWANGEERPLEPHLRGTADVRFIDRAELHAFFSKDTDDGWTQLRAKYPNAPGVVNFSSVGFSAGGERALVYFEYTFASLGGYGMYYLLERTGSTWEILAWCNSWVA
jgi:hypothetical protein